MHGTVATGLYSGDSPTPHPGFEKTSADKPILDASFRWDDVVFTCVALSKCHSSEPIFVCILFMNHTERLKKKWLESIAAGKKVPCLECGESLIVVYAKSGDGVAAKCPRDNTTYPLKNLAEIGSISAGKKVPCDVCGEPLIVMRAEGGNIAGVKCPHEHEVYPLFFHDTFEGWFD